MSEESSQAVFSVRRIWMLEIIFRVRKWKVWAMLGIVWVDASYTAVNVVTPIVDGSYKPTHLFHYLLQRPIPFSHEHADMLDYSDVDKSK